MMSRLLWSFAVLAVVMMLDQTEGWRRRRRRRFLCPVTNCAVDNWTTWSSCTQPCGTGGTQRRQRKVTRPATCGGSCSYALVDSRSCNLGCSNGGTPLPERCNCKTGYSGRCCTGVHGGWSSWSDWNSCSKPCGTGFQERSRSCTSPAPIYGGKPCEGAARESNQCNTHACPVDGGWSSWSDWKSCSKSCGTGFQEHFRSCTRPAPTYGGKPCDGDALESRWCNTHSCPVDGGWSAWSFWSPCDKLCGGGIRERTRSCTNPPPFSGGKGCGSHYHESKECAVNKCPVEGGWSSWSAWTPCNKSCGTGFQERSRSCTQPAPRHGGKACHGGPRESRGCNTHSCPVDGGWSVWGSWSPCSKTCGVGVRERTRSCTNPLPFHGGKGCGLDFHESKECAVSKCPVHGGWSKWSNWTECRVTCGAGVMSRERHCDNPAPAYGGSPCEGRHRDRKSCMTGEICIAGIGCYENYSSVLLDSFTDEIDWFSHFASQMETIIKKCAHLALKKRYRYFAVEGYGNCYGAKNSPSGREPKVTRCNFGVGLDNYYYVYEVSL